MNFSLMAELSNSLVATRAPTPFRFFTPSEKFWETLEPHRDRWIIEFGAGTGELTSEVKNRGFRVVGCDLFTDSRTAVRGVQGISALQFPLAEGMHVIVCRPDHSGWAEHAIQRALDTRCTAWYVGKPCNVKRDLGSLLRRKPQSVLDVGQENETLMSFIP